MDGLVMVTFHWIYHQLLDQKLDDKSIVEDDRPHILLGIDTIYTQKVGRILSMGWTISHHVT